ncbi:MAG: Hsp20/alpha crystallin family protein [Candidatus Nitrosothermus koennekii]|nr:MAG: Hsp20/alpha crystallin family protein [Candidatus Nitrosothermus koennekii]
MSWEEWFKKRMRPFTGPWFYEIEKAFEEMEKMFEESMKEMEKMPKELVRETKLPDGTIKREWGPFVYGYSVTIGPDGKPRIREFGNVKPGLGRFALSEEREPLVDIIEDNETVKILAEIPGVDKKDIKVNATERSVSIRCETPERKYRKEIELPVEVDVSSAKSSYKNGILEITFKKKKRESGVDIKIE